jgi:tryptophan synthase alpha chain
VAGFADGVIVGSAFVRRLLDDQGVPGIRDLTSELSAATRRPAP